MKRGVQVILADTSAVDELLYQQLYTVVSLQRQNKANQYMFRGDRVLSVVGECILIYLISRRHPYAPGLCAMGTGSFGKPFFHNKALPFFNISHCHNAVAVVISDYGSVGIDVENVDGQSEESMGVIQRKCFTDEEQAYMAAGSDYRRLFCTIWTRKEAYFKMTGTGLSLEGLKKQSFTAETDALWTFQKQQYVCSICAVRREGTVITTLEAPELPRIYNKIQAWRCGRE